ncbi:DUF4097 family beta strand repeat-containing protein [Thermobifida cellulosilytica]|uniref:DUF4097 domain-containing protein n=1 Tax=Thermobifida cellulosilytica TB100 TaxID=665004 RepID=A0A147KGZ7_THECS|nr:DUF4097 family beta strand repeat-containing protein [Thermobifida cellulosilytica]KUP96541.1 hypothetical protein AC529_11125 [Thermobifida cellulosilytica TB100]
MARWTIDKPTTRTLDGIVALRVRIIGGHVNILPTDDPVTFEVSELSGEPLLVSHEAGILTVTYADLTRDGLLERLRPVQLNSYRDLPRRSATVSLRVPHDCPVEVTAATASIVAAGLSAKTRLRSGSGDITLDGVSGETEVRSVSGDLEGRGLAGRLSYNSVSGDLELAGGRFSELSAKTASGELLADIDLAPSARVTLGTVSGEVALRLPADTSAEVELRSATGSLDSAFSLDRQDSRGLRRLTGKIGPGVDPATITTTTVSGTVSLLRRAADAPAAIPKGDS